MIQKSSIIITAVAMLLALLGIGAYVYVLQDIKVRTERLAETTFNIALQSERERSFRNAELLIEETENERALLDTYFVDDESVVTLIEDLERMGDETEAPVTIISILEEPSEASSPVVDVLLSLRTVGAWKDVFYLVSLFENLPLKSRISKVRLSHDADSKQWSAIVDLSVVKRKN